jgi:predicted TIM-barrel fold metal-dependent hydrolase
VSSKIAGETASLTNPALDRIMEFAAEVGLPIILHSDISVPFAPPPRLPGSSTSSRRSAPGRS